jgi:hypothetical protein
MGGLNLISIRKSQARPSRLIHFAHNVLRTSLPLSMIRVRWRFGRKVRRVARMEKLRL